MLTKEEYEQFVAEVKASHEPYHSWTLELLKKHTIDDTIGLKASHFYKSTPDLWWYCKHVSKGRACCQLVGTQHQAYFEAATGKGEVVRLKIETEWEIEQ